MCGNILIRFVLRKWKYLIKKFLNSLVRCIYCCLLALHYNTSPIRIPVLAHRWISQIQKLTHLLCSFSRVSSADHRPISGVCRGDIYLINQRKYLIKLHRTPVAVSQFGFLVQENSLREFTWLFVTTQFSKTVRFQNVFRPQENALRVFLGSLV